MVVCHTENRFKEEGMGIYGDILAISWTNMVTTTMLNQSGLNVDTINTNFHVKKFMSLAQERCRKATFCG